MKLSIVTLGILLLGSISANACPEGPPGAKCRTVAVKCPGGGSNAKCAAEVATCKADSNQDKCHADTIEKILARTCLQNAFSYLHTTLQTNSVVVAGGGMPGGMGSREISMVPGSDLLSVVTTGMGGMGMSMNSHVLYAPNGRKITIQENGNCESVTVEKTERNALISTVASLAIESRNPVKCPSGSGNEKCLSAASSLKETCAAFITQGGAGGATGGTR